MSDDDRACEVDGCLGHVLFTGGAAVVFGGDPQPLAVYRSTEIDRQVLVRWATGEGDVSFDAAVSRTGFGFHGDEPLVYTAGSDTLPHLRCGGGSVDAQERIALQIMPGTCRGASEP